MKRQRGMFVATAVALTVALVLVPAGPATAAPSGLGWSASWRYYDPAAFEVHLTIPGGRIDGWASDVNGERSFHATVQDTDTDARTCVQMGVTTHDPNWPYTTVNACEGGSKTFHTGRFYSELFVYIYQLVSGAVTRTSYTIVPSSINDTGLRSIGTGASWIYYTPDAYQVTIERPGVVLTGNGTRQPAGERSLLAVVAHDGAAGDCVEGIAYAVGDSIKNSTCTVGDYATFDSFKFQGAIYFAAVHTPPAAQSRMVQMALPEPQ